MTEILLALTGLVVFAAMLRAYSTSRDPLHPLIILGPMFLFVFVIRPWFVVADGSLAHYLTKDGQAEFAALLFLAGSACFCGGALVASGKKRGRVQLAVTAQSRPQLVRLGMILGLAAMAAYLAGIQRSGGFLVVYGASKGRYSAGSGWINELVNLAIPGAALMVLAWQGDRRHRSNLFWALAIASPLLVHGLLGARRGPTFIILATLLVAWYIGSRKQISLWKVSTRFGLIGLLILFLVSHRQQIHLGSQIDFDPEAFFERLKPRTAGSTDDTIHMYGFVNGVHETNTHYWGARFAATYLVRPIPRQVWRTKYEDLGLGWMVNQADFAGITDERWNQSLGWVPARGSAVGFCADWYLEFGLAGLIGCYAMGWFFGWLWAKASRWGGVWTLLYVQTAALSVYVPTQSVSAVFHRFLFMAIPTILLWRWYLGKSESLALGRMVAQRRCSSPAADKFRAALH